jgi:hypothetical protein
VKWKILPRKRLWFNFEQRIRIYVEKLRKTAENVTQKENLFSLWFKMKLIKGQVKVNVNLQQARRAQWG